MTKKPKGKPKENEPALASAPSQEVVAAVQKVKKQRRQLLRELGEEKRD